MGASTVGEMSLERSPNLCFVHLNAQVRRHLTAVKQRSFGLHRDLIIIQRRRTLFSFRFEIIVNGLEGLERELICAKASALAARQLVACGIKNGAGIIIHERIFAAKNGTKNKLAGRN